MAANVPAIRTRWCHRCKKKKMLWSIAMRKFLCRNCKASVRTLERLKQLQEAA